MPRLASSSHCGGLHSQAEGTWVQSAHVLKCFESLRVNEHLQLPGPTNYVASLARNRLFPSGTFPLWWCQAPLRCALTWPCDCGHRHLHTGIHLCIPPSSS